MRILFAARVRLSAAIWVVVREAQTAEDIFQNMAVKALNRDLVFEHEAEVLSWAQVTARRAPGVLAVYTAADLDRDEVGEIRCLTPMPGKAGRKMIMPTRPVLARDRVQIKLTEIDQIAVNGDRDRLKQVLINLVSNAIKYSPRDGEVYLSLARVGDNARIIVRDTGPGITAEDLPHIFERFYRAEKSRSRSKVGGFGLGLPIAYWIVNYHGGRIEVDSPEGEGTTFCIYLPTVKTN